MLKRKAIILFTAAVISFLGGAIPAKADMVTSNNQALIAQAALNDYFALARANQAALSSTYASQIIASNQYALINQALLAHRYSPGTCNPVSMQATANWTQLNMAIANQNAFAAAIAYR